MYCYYNARYLALRNVTSKYVSPSFVGQKFLKKLYYVSFFKETKQSYLFFVFFFFFRSNKLNTIAGMWNAIALQHNTHSICVTISILF